MTLSFARTVARAFDPRLLLSALAFICLADRAAAQDTTSVRDGWIVGPMLAVPSVGGETSAEVLAVGFSANRLVPNRPGVDLALAVVPYVLSEGALVLAGRLGVGVPFALTRNAFIVPSAGVSAIGGAGGGGVGGIGTVYAGAATVIAAGSLGFRAGVTWNRFGDEPRGLWLLELGLVHVPLASVRASEKQ